MRMRNLQLRNPRAVLLWEIDVQEAWLIACVAVLAVALSWMTWRCLAWKDSAVAWRHIAVQMMISSNQSPSAIPDEP